MLSLQYKLSMRHETCALKLPLTIRAQQKTLEHTDQKTGLPPGAHQLPSSFSPHTTNSIAHCSATLPGNNLKPLPFCQQAATPPERGATRKKLEGTTRLLCAT